MHSIHILNCQKNLKLKRENKCKNQSNKQKRPSENEQSTVGSSGQGQASFIHCVSHK